MTALIPKKTDISPLRLASLLVVAAEVGAVDVPVTFEAPREVVAAPVAAALVLPADAPVAVPVEDPVEALVADPEVVAGADVADPDEAAEVALESSIVVKTPPVGAEGADAAAAFAAAALYSVADFPAGPFTTPTIPFMQCFATAQ